MVLVTLFSFSHVIDRPISKSLNFGPLIIFCLLKIADLTIFKYTDLTFFKGFVQHVLHMLKQLKMEIFY